MMALENLVHTPLAQALGWTLFHSLWEGAVAAMLLVVGAVRDSIVAHPLRPGLFGDARHSRGLRCHVLPLDAGARPRNSPR